MASRGYVLAFDGHEELHRKRFAVLYAGFVLGGDQAQEGGMEALRLKSRTLAALQAISDRPAVGLDEAVRGVRLLRAGVHELQLDGEQFEALTRYVSSYRGWHTEAVGDVLEAVEWVGALASRVT